MSPKNIKTLLTKTLALALAAGIFVATTVVGAAHSRRGGVRPSDEGLRPADEGRRPAARAGGARALLPARRLQLPAGAGDDVQPRLR